VGDKSGAMLVVAALILGASIVGASLIVQTSIDRTANELAGLKVAVSNMEIAAAPAAAPSRGGRPDPARRYTLNTKGSPSKGAEKPKIAVVEFSDFQCPFCGRVNPTMQQVQDNYGDSVEIVFKHLPLRIHSKAAAAHAAAEAAHRQGKFWEMHDKIFANQREMSPEKYVEYAGELGLDVGQFQKDVASAEVKAKVDADSQEAAKLGVTGTPAFFINGRFLSGAQPYESFKRLIDEELKRAG